MAHAAPIDGADASAADRPVVVRGPAYHAFAILYAGFTVLPIVAGIDKFFNALVDWSEYLAPVVTDTLPLSADQFMMIVGVVEIVAGLLVAWRPGIGAYIVTLWLWAIIINLLIIPGYFDIALRDFGLSLGALALGRLSAGFSRQSLAA